MTLRRREGKRVRLNGAALPSAEQLRSELTTLVFTPDRLAVVKGGPAVRRAYLDRSLGRVLPARASLPGGTAPRCRTRNAALRRVAAGLAGRDALDPWTEQVAALGRGARRGRREARSTLLAAPFAERAGELGLDGATLATRARRRPPPRSRRGGPRPRARAHDARARTSTTSRSSPAPRDLRLFGSQGEQRLAVLSLLLAEAAAARRARPPAAPAARRCALRARHGAPPRARRAARAGRPDDRHRHGARCAAGRPAQVVEVRPGSAVARELASRSATRCGASSGASRGGRDDRDRRRVARGGRRRDRAQRLAGAPRAGRHAARRDELLGLGLRADAARAATILPRLQEAVERGSDRRSAFAPGPVPGPSPTSSRSRPTPLPRRPARRRRRGRAS